MGGGPPMMAPRRQKGHGCCIAMIFLSILAVAGGIFGALWFLDLPPFGSDSATGDENADANSKSSETPKSEDSETETLNLKSEGSETPKSEGSETPKSDNQETPPKASESESSNPARDKPTSSGSPIPNKIRK